MNIYTIAGANKAEFLANVKDVISTSMNGILQYANEDDENIWFSIVGSAKYVRFYVSGTDPNYSVYVYLTNQPTGTGYIDTFGSGYKLIYLLKMQGGEVAITGSLASEPIGYFNLKLHNLITGYDYIGYVVGGFGAIYIEDSKKGVYTSDHLVMVYSGSRLSKTFYPFMFKISNDEIWLVQNFLCCFSYFGLYKKMLYNGKYYRCVQGANNAKVAYYIKDGE